MAKALTNGVVPMGAVACSDTIYETITSAAPESAIELFHGYTYSGCPVAAAAGLATRDIFEQHVTARQDAHQQQVDRFLSAADHLPETRAKRADCRTPISSHTFLAGGLARTRASLTRGRSADHSTQGMNRTFASAT
jgi:adenosylmethionine-8-amino-7-oxononanoate aminotransferase